MNAKIAKTKQVLLAAYCELLKSHAAKDISVSQLCRTAGVNRSTFYKHYALPDEIITEKVEEFVQNFLIVALQTPQLNIETHMLKMCEVLKQNAWIIQLHSVAGKDLSQLMQKMLPKGSIGTEKGYAYSFISGGVAALAMQWVVHGCKQAPAKIARLLAGLIKTQLDTCQNL